MSKKAEIQNNLLPLLLDLIFVDISNSSSNLNLFKKQNILCLTCVKISCYESTKAIISGTHWPYKTLQASICQQNKKLECVKFVISKAIISGNWNV